MAELGQLYWSTGLNTSGLKKDSAKAQGIIGKLGGGLGSAMGAATIGVAAVGAAVVKLGKEAYEFSKAFDSAMLEVKTISESVQDDFEGISESIMNISLQGINDDAIGLSQAFYQIVSAGHDGADGLEVLEAAAKAATGGVTDTKTAADGLTTVMNAWGKSAADVNNISDVMFTTVKLGKTTMGELSSSIAQVAPLASSMGVGLEEVFSAVASITKQGVPTAQAMTQIRASMISMNEVLGEGWNETMSYQEGLQAIMDKAGGSQIALKEMMGRIEGVSAVLALTGDKAAGAMADLEAHNNAVGAAADAYKIMADDASIMWKQVGNQFKVAMSDIGDGLVEGSKGLAAFLNAAMTGKDQLGDDFESIGENVEGFNERMKVLRNEGVSFFDAIAGAAFKSNEKVQRIVDAEKKEAADTLAEIAAIKAEYSRLQESGADEAQLAAFKQNLHERYKAIKEETDAELELQQKNAKQAKTFSALTLGLGSASSTRENLKAKDLKDVADGYSDIFDAVQKLGVVEEENAENLDKNTNDAIERLRTISDIEAELKALQEKKGSFTSAQKEADNIQLIQNKAAELEAAWQRVRDARIQALGGLITGAPGEQKLETIKPETLTVNKPKLQLATMKQMTAEQKKQLEIQIKKDRAEIKSEAKLGQTKDTLEDVSGILGDGAFLFGEIGNSVSKINPELGEMLSQVGEMAGKAANFTSSLASGDWVGAVASGVGLFADLIAAMSESRTQVIEATSVQRLEAYNDALLKSSDTMKSLISSFHMLSGQESFMSFNKGMKKQSEFLDAIINNYKNLNKEQEGLFGDTVTKAETLLLDLERTQLAMLREGISEAQLATAQTHIQRILDEIAEIETAYSNMMSAMEEVVGVSSSTITDNIVDGLLEGFKLAEDGLGDFADTFGEMMKQSGTNYLKQLFESKYLMGLMEKFSTLAADGLTAEEIESFKSDYKKAIEEFKIYTDAWSEITGDISEAVEPELSGIAGAISGISEETGSLIEGQFNAMRINQLDMNVLLQDHSNYLNQIQINTAAMVAALNISNGHLSSMDSNISGGSQYT